MPEISVPTLDDLAALVSELPPAARHEVNARNVEGKSGGIIGYVLEVPKAWASHARSLARDLPAVRLSALKRSRLTQVMDMAAGVLAAGAPMSCGLHIAVDENSRANLTAMGSIALAAVSGSGSWPDGYSLGWIAVENVRIPLPTPADGLALATAAASFHASVVQRRRDLKDAISAARDEDSLVAIDIKTAWPWES